MQQKGWYLLKRKSIIILLGIGLIFIGIIISAPVIASMMGTFFKGYFVSSSMVDYGRILLGLASAIAGFVILFIGIAKKAIFWISILGVFIIIMGSGSYFSYKQVMEISNNKDKVEAINIDKDKGILIDIPLGSNTVDIVDILNENGVIKHPFIYKMLSKINGYDNTYQAGTHIVSKDLNYDEIMRVLSSKPESLKVTIQEGLTYKQTVDLLVRKKIINQTKFESEIRSGKYDYKFLKDLPKRENKFEGYLFPDTYEFATKAGEKAVIKAMLDNFNLKFKNEYYQKAKDLNMTIDQIIILASIIEKESGNSEDRRMISSVFYKRLNSKDKTMRKLQSDATLQYVFVNRDGAPKKDILLKDLEIDDPYNSYKYAGLPPGPICSPGADSIIAALNPEKTDYWYFVADGAGRTVFSKTLKEQTAAMNKYGFLTK
jgi:UPF0755 protein